MPRTLRRPKPTRKRGKTPRPRKALRAAFAERLSLSLQRRADSRRSVRGAAPRSVLFYNPTRSPRPADHPAANPTGNRAEAVSTLREPGPAGTAGDPSSLLPAPRDWLRGPARPVATRSPSHPAETREVGGAEAAGRASAAVTPREPEARAVGVVGAGIGALPRRASVPGDLPSVGASVVTTMKKRPAGLRGGGATTSRIAGRTQIPGVGPKRTGPLTRPFSHE